MSPHSIYTYNAFVNPVAELRGFFFILGRDFILESHLPHSWITIIGMRTNELQKDLCAFQIMG